MFPYMDITNTDIIWLLAALLFLNMLLVLFIQTEGRFWYPSVVLWLGLFFTLILLHVNFGYAFDNQQVLNEYNRARELNSNPELISQELEAEQQDRILKRKVFRLLVAQSFLSLCLMTLGYQKTGRPMYRKASLTFVGLSFIALVLEILLFMDFI